MDMTENFQKADITEIIDEISFELYHMIDKPILVKYIDEFSLGLLDSEKSKETTIIESGTLREFSIDEIHPIDMSDNPKRKNRISDQELAYETSRQRAKISLALWIESYEEGRKESYPIIVRPTIIFGNIYKPIRMMNGDLYPNEGDILYLNSSMMKASSSKLEKL